MIMTHFRGMVPAHMLTQQCRQQTLVGTALSCVAAVDSTVDSTGGDAPLDLLPLTCMLSR